MNLEKKEVKIILSNDDLLDFINDESRIKEITNSYQKISKTLCSSEGSTSIKGRLLEVLSLDKIQSIWSGLHIGMRTGKQGFDGVFVIDNDIYLLESKYRSKSKISNQIIKEAADSLTSSSSEVSNEANEIFLKYGLNSIASISAMKQVNEPELRKKIAYLFVDYDCEKIEYAIFSFGINDDFKNEEILTIRRKLLAIVSENTKIINEKNIKILVFILKIGEDIVNEIREKDKK